MKTKLSLIALSLLGLAACGGSTDAAEPGSKAATGTGAQPSATTAEDPSCPVAVPGTSVAVQEADGGVALVFTTTGDVADVRRRAREMARMHNEMHAKMGPLPTGDSAAGGHDHGSPDHGAAGAAPNTPAGEHGAQEGGGEHGGHAGGVVQIHSHAVAEDIEGVARVVFHPAAEQMAALRDDLANHAQHLSAGRCDMKH
jgi:hypothetical protein